MRLHEFHDYIAEKKREEAAQTGPSNFVTEEMGSLEAPHSYDEVSLDAESAKLQNFQEFVSFAGRIEQYIDRIRATNHIGDKIDTLAELIVEMATMPEVNP